MSNRSVGCIAFIVVLIIKLFVVSLILFLGYFIVISIQSEAFTLYEKIKFYNSKEYKDNGTEMAVQLEEMSRAYKNAQGFTKDSIEIVVRHKYKYWDISESPEHIRNFVNSIREKSKI